jgi:hypothetical protein
MKTTDRDLYEKALGYYTCNASEIVDDIIENDDWAEVVLWEPFENWEVNDIQELVEDLYADFLELKNK